MWGSVSPLAGWDCEEDDSEDLGSVEVCFLVDDVTNPRHEV